MFRYAELSARYSVDSISAYLPGNYRVLYADGERIIISGEDNAGWTLDDYVIPRLASGLYFAQEIPASKVPTNYGNSAGFNPVW